MSVRVKKHVKEDLISWNVLRVRFTWLREYGIIELLRLEKTSNII